MPPEIWVALIMSVPTAWVGWLQFGHRRALGAVRDQVENTHSTNLREDLDRIRDLAEGTKLLAAGTQRQVQLLTDMTSGLYKDLRQERRELSAVEQRVTAAERRIGELDED